MSAASHAADLQGSLADADAPPPVRPGVRGVAIVAAFVGLGDVLLYRGPLGIALAVFILVLALGALLTNRVCAKRGAPLGFGILLAGVLPFAVNPGPLSLAFATAATALFAALMFANPRPGLRNALAAARDLAGSAVRRAPVDVFHAIQEVASKRPKSPAGLFLAWFVPVTLGVVFAALLADANPVIARWIAAIDIGALVRVLTAPLEGSRIAFWLILAMLVWPVLFVHPWRRPARAARPARSGNGTARRATSAVLSDGAIVRSLVVFNGLFAVQTVLDAAYLWGGLALPEGMTYAQYAHRGAYALMATAVLAAAFVIVALKPGSSTERMPTIRALVYVWIGQTVMLVASAMLRLDLYVAAYALTHWRLAAFVWMLLVGIGLVLILARIASGRSNRWLIGANLISLAATLYLAAFANFASLIAHYNVAHSAEMGGGGPALDRLYLRRLGARAIPAADLFLARNPDSPDWTHPAGFARWRADEEAALRSRMQDWRAWSYLDWQLLRYLDTARASPIAAP